MKRKLLFLFISSWILPSLSYAASCSHGNLTKCLDSVCAINIGANPAARCQYCGSDKAGDPTKNSTGMKALSAGLSTKYTITEKELKKAPNSAGKRYIWGAEQCLKKVENCTAEDVSDVYDKLIEQSCTAAGIVTEMADLTEQANTAKTKSSCSSSISSCIIADKRCGASYSKCEDEAIFDRYFAECGVESAGCDGYLTDIRKTLYAAKNSAIENADKLLAKIVSEYQNSRTQKVDTAKANCTDDKGKLSCIESVCKNNMRHNCDIGYEQEKAMATQLCKYYDTACERIK